METIPEDIVLYIMSFLIQCDSCKKLHTNYEIIYMNDGQMCRKCYHELLSMFIPMYI